MHHAFSAARKTRDKAFDGSFFFGVKTTGIFCRPSCPSPRAKEENVLYFTTLFAALEHGFRPCHRCRPDIEVPYCSGNVNGGILVERALAMIYNGFLHDHTLAMLAEELQVSARHLRALFVENLGVPPVTIARYHKALFAKKLLLYSDQSITDAAMASGFGSLRQFNAVFKKVFGRTPTAVRKEASAPRPRHPQTKGEGGCPHNTLLLLPYKPPFHFAQLLSFVRARAITGVEVITETLYSRTFRLGTTRGYFAVTDNPGASALELRIGCDDIRCYMAVCNSVRKMFDMDTDMSAIQALLSRDPALLPGMTDGHVPRLPVAFDPFEFVVRAILGQQITVKAATTLAGRIAGRAALATGEGFPPGLGFFFPDPAELLSLDLSGIGITTTRQATLRGAATHVLNGDVTLTPNQTFEAFHRDFSALKGIGEWTVHYVAMRGLGMRDSFPSTDLGIMKALAREGTPPTKKEIETLAEAWRPYRAYATLCLWNKKNDGTWVPGEKP